MENRCKVCGSRIPDSIGECTFCNSAINDEEAEDE